MLRAIVRSSLRFRYLVVAGAAALMFFGVQQLQTMPVDVFPEFAPPRVEIQTAAIGLSAAEVESLVTIPLEQSLNGISELDIIRSKSVPQLSSIELLFDEGTDILEARQLVAERVAAVSRTIPTWAAPPVILPPVSTTGRVMEIGLSSNTIDLRDMSMIAYWTIRARLLRVPGVANVAIWGERIKMPQVQVDPARLERYGVTLDQVMTTTSDAVDSGLLRFSSGAVIGKGGFIDTPNQRLQIQHSLPVTAEDLAHVPIEGEDGRTLTLADVADVREGTWPMIGDAVIDDGPGLMLVVEKYPWANTLELTRGVERALDELRPGMPGLKMDPTIFQAADFIDLAIHNLARALVIGSMLVLLVLGLFLFEWRTALISLVAIPLSLLTAALILDARGATINTMVLTGMVIAVGVVVDDAIIDIENIVRRLRIARRERAERAPSEVILDASLEVRSAIIYATLIDVATLLPILFVPGLTGALFAPLALSYGLAVLASMLVALTVTPALGMILLRNAPIERRESPIVRWMQPAYQRVLQHSVTHPLRVASVGIAVFLMGVVALPQLGEALLPEFKERDFLTHWIAKPGTSLPEERRIVTAASRDLRAIPGVQSFGSHIGQAMLAEEIVGANFGENWITIDPAADYDATLARIQEVVDSYPGLYHDVLTYFNERVDEVLAGSTEPIVVRIFGEDLDQLRAKAQEVRHLLADIPGISEEHVSFQEDVPQIEVRVDLDAAQGYGLKPGDVRRAAATMMNGEEVGDIFRDGKAYDVNVWSTPASRNSLTDIRRLQLDTPDGGRVALHRVADVRIRPTPNAIEREGDSRRIDVEASVEGRDLGSVVRDVQTAVEGVDFPLGYHAEFLGEYAERQAAQGRLLLYALIAVAAVFLLLRIALHTWRLAWLAFLDLPIALAGGVIATYLAGGTISLGSLVGFFTVLGIAARTGIMMINHFQHLERFEGETFGPALVLRGARERLSPIMMTALATGLAVIPLVVAGNLPGHEIEHPMAIVIVGGLITSTFRNLFIVPALYLRWGRGALAPARPDRAA
ncbi:MAG TPA: efflux RND transporter permease subunit [Actinomycetota bacterium]|nr:efflux RND transporter permease subunit [Actinomycetota bacterium]